MAPSDEDNRKRYPMLYPSGPDDPQKTQKDALRRAVQQQGGGGGGGGCPLIGLYLVVAVILIVAVVTA